MKKLIFVFLCSLFLTGTVIASDPAQLVAHWKLNELSGTAAADSYSTFNGVYNGFPSLVQGEAGAIGGTGTSVKFVHGMADGSLDDVNVPYNHTADPNFSGHSFSVSFWAKPTFAEAGEAGLRCALSSRSTASAPLGWCLYAGSNWQFMAGSGNGWTTTNGAGVTDDVWKYIVVSFDWDGGDLSGSGAWFGQARLYTNGNLDANELTLLKPNPDNPFRMGALADTTGYAFNGNIDDVQYYKGVLTTAQVQWLYNNPGLNLTQTAWKVRPITPPDKAVDVDVTSALSWAPVTGTVPTNYDVYLGKVGFVLTKVVSALNVTSYDPPGNMDFAANYQWRVNVRVGTTVTVGPLWTFTSASARAGCVTPANGSSNVNITTNLVWSAPTAVTPTGYNVYFGTDANNLTKVVDNQTVTNYTPPANLNYGTKYTWRVDVLVGATTYTGLVWNFTTFSYAIVDDFESYTVDNINSTWSSGSLDYTSGSTVNLTVDQKHGGPQAMQLDYDNTGNTPSDAKFSKTARTVTGGAGFAISSIEAMDLYLRGSAGNAKDPLFITISDATHNATIDVNTTDANLASTNWQVVRVDLTKLGFSKSNINKIGIGVGDKNNVVAGGTGTIYIDDIRLYPQRCLHGNPYGDVNGDCKVDFKDLGIAANSWLGNGMWP